MKKFYFLFLFALIASISNLYAAEKTVTWNFDNFPEDGLAAEKFKSYNLSGEKCASTGGKASADIVTVNKYVNITNISFKISKTSKNSKSSVYKVYISENGKSWINVGASPNYTSAEIKNGKWTDVSLNFAQDKKTGYVKIEYTGSTAERLIDAISITYEEAEGPTPVVSKCAAPTFTPAAGFLKLGNAITFTSATADAEVYYQYSYNGGEYNSFVKGTSFTPDKEGTYKIIAKATKTGLEDGVSEEQIYEVGNLVFYESFDKNDGTGGNDGRWNGSIAANDIQYDVTGWTCENAKGANMCAKFGTGGAKGKATTPALAGLEGDAILTFKAAPWGDEGGKMTVSISNGTIENSEFDLSNQTFTEYSVKIRGGATSKITFTSENNRFFLDEVKVVAIVKEPKEPTVTLGFTAAEINERPWIAANDIVLTEEATEVKDASCVKLTCEEGVQIEYTLVSAETGSSTATVESGAEIVGLIKGEVYELTVCAVKGGYKSASRQYTFTITGSTSSVSSMSAEGVKVFAAEGGVEVVADEAADVAVYTVAGQLVRQARVAEGNTLVNVAPGFYVVRANGTATKVIVR